jgi:hypothetical protein
LPIFVDDEVMGYRSLAASLGAPVSITCSSVDAAGAAEVADKM